MSGAFGTNWMDLSSTSNRYIQTYYRGFVDISGGPLYVRNNNLYVQGGDVSLNGRLYVKNDTTLIGNLIINNVASYINPTSSNAISSSWTSAGITWNSSASTSLTPFYNYLAFNGNVTDSWASAQTYNGSTGAYTGTVTTTVTTAPSTTQAVTGEWLQIQTSTALALNNYTFTSGGFLNQLLKSFFIVGSNDGTNWFAIQSAVIANFPVTTNNTLIPTVISANSAVTTAYGISTITTTTYSTYTTTLYTYFRLITQAVLPSGNGYAQIGEWTPYFTVVSNITLNVDSTVLNQLNLSNNLSVGGNLITSLDASMNGNLSIAKDMTIGGNLYVKTYTTRQTITELSYQLIVAQDLSLNGRLFLSNDASINNRLFVGSDVSMGGNLFISKVLKPVTISESFVTNTGTTSPYALNYSTGSTFYITTPPATNFTVNLTNVPTDINRTYVVTLIITSTTNKTFCNSLQINGNTAITPNFANGIPASITSGNAITQSISIQRITLGDVAANNSVLSAVTAWY